MRPDNLRAALVLTFGMLAFAMEDVLIKVLAGELPHAQVLAIIGGAGTLVFGALLRLGGGRFWTRHLLHPAVVLRNLAEAVAAVAIVLALALTDLSTTAAIMQAAPLFITLGAAAFLGEAFRWRRGIAIGLGFLGVLMILRPGMAGFQPAALWAVLSALALAARDLATRRIPAGMRSLQISTSAFVAVLIASLLMGLALGEPPARMDATQGVLALGCVAMTVIGYSCLVSATRIGEASALAPVRYSRLVFAFILAAAVLGEGFDLLTLLGAAIIVGSGCYMIWRETRLAGRRPIRA